MVGLGGMYLHDGVYAELDQNLGYIWVATRRERGIERVALDYECWLALNKLAEQMGWSA